MTLNQLDRSAKSKTLHSASTLIAGLVLCGNCLTGCATRVLVDARNRPLVSRPIQPVLVETSWQSLQRGNPTPKDLLTYNSNVRRSVLRAIRNGLLQGKPTGSIEDGIQVDFQDVRGFHRIDELLFADQIEIQSGIRDRTAFSGMGAPLLGRLRRSKEDSMIPESGLWIPLTAVLTPQRQELRLRILDPSKPCSSANLPLPIAMDFTAPLARDLLDRQRQFQKAKALVNYEKFAPHMGIGRVFAFDPEKTPVVLVHGLLSSPVTWTNAINEWMAYPEIRHRYEFWTFFYPTGAPIPHLAQRLRSDVEKMAAFRAAHSARSSEVIMIGHSMGGLLSKTLTQSSGDAQWHRFFKVPPEQLEVSAEEQEILRSMFYFEPLPYVKRVIFSATPHHGSKSAKAPPARLADALIRSPRVILSTTRNILQSGAQSLTPLGMEITRDFPSSIEHMSHDSVLGKVFSELPLNPKVQYYSVIGSLRGTRAPLERMTDGIVRYHSAHIEGVQSETIVRSSHALHRSPAGIAEIARILIEIP